MQRLVKLEEENKKWANDIEKVWSKLNDLFSNYQQKNSGDDTSNRVKEMELKVLQAEKEAAEAKAELERLKNSGVDKIENLNGRLQVLVREELTKIGMDGQDRAEGVKQQVRNEMTKMIEAWQADRQKDRENFREILNKEMKEQQQGMERKVVNVIKSREDLVQDIADKKKSVILFGVKEERMAVKADRVAHDKTMISRVFEELGEENWLTDEVVEHIRLGKFEEGKHRPIKIKFNSQAPAEFMLYYSWKLHEHEDFRRIFIRRNMSEQEREQLKELLTEVKRRNDERTEEEREQFFWRVRHETIGKRWIQDDRRERRWNQ